MKIDVNERRENALLEREEIRLSIDHTGEATPSENALRKQLAAELDLDPLTVQVDHIYSPSGAARSTAQVTVFEEPIMDELPEDNPDEGEDAEAADEAEDAGDDAADDNSGEPETGEDADDEEEGADEEDAGDEHEGQEDGEDSEREEEKEEDA